MAREVDRMCFTEPEVEEDGEVELSLGLSIGGGCRKAVTGGGSLRASGSAAVYGDADLDLGGGDMSLAKPGAASFFLAASGEAQRSRELQALRRKEARRKREEKQKRKVIGHEGSGVLPGCDGPATACSEEDRMALQAQELESRAKDRKAREDEASWAVGSSHGQKCRVTDSQIPEIVGVQNPNPNPAPQPFPVVQMQQPCYQVQYVPVVNGFGIPCTMPCWVPAISPATADSSSLPERTVNQPVACRLPAPARQPMGCYPDLNTKLAPLSADSPGSSSSGISDHQTTASLHEGKSSSSSSSDGGAKSHSSHTLAENPRPQASSQASNPQGNSGQCVSRHPVSKAIEEGTDKLVSSTPHSTLVSNSDAAAPTQGKLEGSASVNKPNPEDPRTGPSPSLPRMPCVATTGDGPDGRTITGFLYRYTRSEVSIVCVCHGSSFSPAGFVEHAGGTDISHPLRQIIVVHS